jgi:hypothetical protein
MISVISPWVWAFLRFTWNPDALAELKQGSTTFTDASLFFRSRKNLNEGYRNRALGVMVGVFGNAKKVLVYFAVPKDGQGELLDGEPYRHGPTQWVLTRST